MCVRFDRIRAKLNRTAEGRKGVLWKLECSAAMSVNPHGKNQKTASAGVASEWR